MSKFKQYQVFVCVSEQGSISKAAPFLNMSQPAISKQLVLLEQSLKTQLFVRSHKKLTLTAAGKQFLQRCKRILADIRSAEEQLLDHQDALTGRIAITFSKAISRGPIFTLLGAFAEHYPNIRFDLRLNDTFEDMHGEDIDFALRLGQLRDNSHLIGVPLIETSLVACATPDYLQNAANPQNLTDLREHKLVLMSPLSSSVALRDYFVRHKIDKQLDKFHHCDDIEGVFQSVKAGLGIGFLLDLSIQKELQDGSLIQVLNKEKLPRKMLYLVYKKSEKLSQKQHKFKEFVKSHFLPQ